MRRLLIRCLIAAGWVGCASAAPEQLPLPQVSDPVPVTATSYPFAAASHQRRPVDLGAQGYVETEYLLSGQARVFDWPDAAGLKVLAQGPYTTRILVRRPKDARRFSGTVIVELLNPSEDVDLPIMWAESYRQFLRDGDAWVGVTVKPNTIAALRHFDPVRYAAVSLPNPRPAPACEDAQINPLSRPASTAAETGLAWDLLSQLGALLKSRAPGNPIPWTVQRLYMTGQSQTAGYARTYASVFARTVASPSGRPLYDAYLYSGSPPWQVPLNQCRADLAAGDPRLITPAVGVPVMEIFTQGDLGTNVQTRRPDADTTADRFRRYEVAGAPHVDPWEELSFASDADRARAGARENRAVEATCQPAGVTPTDFPNRYVLDAAWRNLDRWVREGVPPPHADPLVLRAAAGPFQPDSAFVTDVYGNARGGVRMPALEVPTARWVGAKTGAFTCLFIGYKYPFSPAQLARLYPDDAAYQSKLRMAVTRLRAAHWLTPEDSDEILRDAGAAIANARHAH